jgi:hypothetical protein
MNFFGLNGTVNVILNFSCPIVYSTVIFQLFKNEKMDPHVQSVLK